MSDASVVEETFKRLQSHKGVQGVVVINADGITIKSTFDNDVTCHLTTTGPADEKSGGTPGGSRKTKKRNPPKNKELKGCIKDGGNAGCPMVAS